MRTCAGQLSVYGWVKKKKKGPLRCVCEFWQICLVRSLVFAVWWGCGCSRWPEAFSLVAAQREGSGSSVDPGGPELRNGLNLWVMMFVDAPQKCDGRFPSCSSAPWWAEVHLWEQMPLSGMSDLTFKCSMTQRVLEWIQQKPFFSRKLNISANKSSSWKQKCL